MTDQTPENRLKEIQVEDRGAKGRYFVTGPDGSVAEMTFTKVGDHQLIIDHTEVPDAFRGQGIGLKLVTRAVEDARAAAKTIIPLCPFFKAQVERHPEWSDVISR